MITAAQARNIHHTRRWHETPIEDLIIKAAYAGFYWINYTLIPDLFDEEQNIKLYLEEVGYKVECCSDGRFRWLNIRW